MRTFNRAVFDNTVYAGTEQFTAAEFDEVLGSADQLIVHARVTRASTALNVSVEVYHSNDRQDWLIKGVAILTVIAGTGQESSQMGFDTGSPPSAAFVRLRVTADTGEAYVRLVVSGRNI